MSLAHSQAEGFLSGGGTSHQLHLVTVSVCLPSAIGSQRSKVKIEHNTGHRLLISSLYMYNIKKLVGKIMLPKKLESTNYTIQDIEKYLHVYDSSMKI